MITELPTSLLGKGLYAPAEAAYLARISTQMMKRWVHGSNSGDAVVRGQLPDDPEQLVTFLDLIQALAIRAIRKDKRSAISLSKIREFVQIAKTEYGVRFPFARRHASFAFDDDLVLLLEDDRLIQITGKYKKHQLIKSVVEIYMEDLSYDPSGLADQFIPFRYQDRKIIISPLVRFGEPIVYPCGQAVFSLAEAARCEGSIDAAADAYAVDRGDIVAALKYEDYLDGVA